MEAAEEGISGPGDIAFPGHKPLELRSSTPGSVFSAFLEMTQSFPFPPTDSDARPAGRSHWSEVMLEEAADCLLLVSFPENVVKAVFTPPKPPNTDTQLSAEKSPYCRGNWWPGSVQRKRGRPQDGVFVT